MSLPDGIRQVSVIAEGLRITPAGVAVVFTGKPQPADTVRTEEMSFRPMWRKWHNLRNMLMYSKKHFRIHNFHPLLKKIVMKYPLRTGIILST
jgi:hypothetical protein